MVGFFYREEREGAQRGFMGLGINREEREGARRGRIFNRKECGGITRWDLTQIMQMHNLG